MAATLPGMAAEPVTIQVSADQRQGRIEPMLYGQFIEHLGSCINGGIFEPGSPLADELGFRRDVMDKVRELNPPILRWPGGTFTKIYHWQDALAVASWLNAMQRHAEIIGFATWAQMVNIIAPIQADQHGSIRQTVFHPLALFAKHSRNWNVAVRCDSPPLPDGKLPALDVANHLSRREQDCVRRRELPAASGPVKLTLPAASVTVVLFAPNKLDFNESSSLHSHRHTTEVSQ